MNDLLDDGLWETVAALARRKGIAHQSMHERVDRLEADGSLTVRRDGRTKLVSVAEYDRAVGQVGDAFKEAAAATVAEIDIRAPTSPALRDHQARAAQYTADLKFLELEEKLGRLVPIAEVKEAGAKLGEAVVRAIDRLPTFAEAISSAASKDGVQGVRGALKQIAIQLRTEIAEAIGAATTDAKPWTVDPASGHYIAPQA